LEETDCLHFRLEDEGNKFLRQPLAGLNAAVVQKLGIIAVKLTDSCSCIDAQCDTELMSYKPAASFLSFLTRLLQLWTVCSTYKYQKLFYIYILLTVHLVTNTC